MTDDTNKPDNVELKVVSINSKLDEIKEVSEGSSIETKQLNRKLVELYAISREIFSNIEDVEIQYDAIHHLRKAFLLALNPLQKIDDQFSPFWILEEE